MKNKIKCATIRYKLTKDSDTYEYLYGPSHEYCYEQFVKKGLRKSDVCDLEEGYILKDTNEFVYTSVVNMLPTLLEN